MNDVVSWSANPLGDNSIAVVEAMERAVTVDVIATFEPKLVWCEASDKLEDLASSPAHQPYDYLPVRQPDGRIVGLLPLHEFRNRPMRQAGETASVSMQPLDQSILIASGTGALAYIEEADQHPCRLVMRGTRIAGIVTISDLQKLPVRPALFLLVTHLELLMAAVIRERFRGRADVEWLIHLGQQRRECVEAKWQELQAKNLAIDQINATQFADKRQILLKSGLLKCSRTQAEKEFGAIERLRNNLAHASDYALTLDRGQETIATIKCARKWIEYLGTMLDEAMAPSGGPPSRLAF